MTLHECAAYVKEMDDLETCPGIPEEAEQKIRKAAVVPGSGRIISPQSSARGR